MMRLHLCLCLATAICLTGCGSASQDDTPPAVQADAAAATAPTTASPAAMPNLVCRGEGTVLVLYADLRTDRYVSTELYRFVDGKLYISDEDVDEYFYNDVQTVDSVRYTSGHMTFIVALGGGSFEKMTMVIAGQYDTRVLQLRCVKADS